jgi:hypothetical protein
MLRSFADHHKIPQTTYAATGAFDPVLGVDTQLFIDPSLLRDAETPEFSGSHTRVREYFGDVLKIVQGISAPQDRLFREADRLLTFPEVNGLCIGYSKGVHGSGMGSAIRSRLLTTIMQIVKAGTSDPAIFELVGTFEEGVGPDRISDMVARIILPDLIAFTQRICSDLGVPMEEMQAVKGGDMEDLPVNPVTGGPLILVPKEILRDLPVAEEYSDIVWIAQQNQKLREHFNAMIGEKWSEVTRAERKRVLKVSYINEPDILALVLKVYREAKLNAYDFDVDPAGEVAWYRASRDVVSSAPLDLTLPETPDKKDVEAVVATICEHFRKLVEDNQLCKLLYDGSGKPKHESAAQLLFFGIAQAYCEANDIDLTAESDAGRGPVDFKASRGYTDKVVVEVKLTTNKNLISGFQNQLPIYQKAEKPARGVYLVIHNGGSVVRLAALQKEAAQAGGSAPRVLIVDAIPKASASKAKSPD